MAKIINLRQARKARERASAKAKADQNSVVFGLSKAEKTRLETEKERAVKSMDGRRLDGDGSDASEDA